MAEEHITESKRVNFLLSSRAHTELVRLSRRSNQSMTELLRMGLGLVRIAVDAKERGERLVVVNAAGQPDREIVLPMS